MAILRKWSLICRDSVYTAPELRRVYVQGIVEGHRKILNGKIILTSHIERVLDKNNVQTYSGTTYTLADPDPKWVDWMKCTGYQFDESDPLNFEILYRH